MAWSPPTAACYCPCLFCLQALGRYQKLAALLRGEYPAGLLPPAPPGYIADRIRELAGALQNCYQTKLCSLNSCWAWAKVVCQRGSKSVRVRGATPQDMSYIVLSCKHA